MPFSGLPVRTWCNSTRPVLFPISALHPFTCWFASSIRCRFATGPLIGALDHLVCDPAVGDIAVRPSFHPGKAVRFPSVGWTRQGRTCDTPERRGSYGDCMDERETSEGSIPSGSHLGMMWIHAESRSNICLQAKRPSSSREGSTSLVL